MASRFYVGVDLYSMNFVAFGDEPIQVLKVTQLFGQHCIRCLQGEYVGWDFFFWEPYVRQGGGAVASRSVALNSSREDLCTRIHGTNC
jgi:hypothetical protein